MTLGLIWAQSTAGVIGRDGTLPWRLPEDLAHFKAVTAGQPVIMGRRTWESLPERFRPLPGRRNIVLSHRTGLQLPGAEVAASLAEAVQLIRTGAPGAPAAAATGQPAAGLRSTGSPPQAWVIGGAQVYAAALPLAAVAEVTEIDVDVAGDTFAPGLTGWTLTASGDWQRSSTGLRYRFLRYRRPPVDQHVSTP
jgi:dihydrofolate reductase